MPVYEATARVANKYGLHARPITMFVQTASSFKSEIQITKDGYTVDGKSIMGLLTLGAPQGSVLTVRADGADAEEAVKSIVRLIDSKFNEE